MSDPLRDRLAAALGPSYELQRLLGKGGMGSVYLARETALERLVAVKVLLPEATGDAETRERFRREARTAAKLTHPHIVPLYTFGEAEGLLWFVMGYVAGETLAAKLERTPRMDPESVRRILADVADALDYAHSHGIVHRDVKPENILIEDTGGKALLADFGVARQGTGSTTLTTAGALVGTPLYMSPEQASGERELDGRSDIYSLGVVGYRMLAGRTPFEGSELRAVLAAHVMQPVPALPADIPEDLAGALMRAMAKAPMERWGSGRDLRRHLDVTGMLGEETLDRFGALPAGLTSVGVLAPVILLIWAAIREVPWVSYEHDEANVLLLVPPAALVTVLGIIWFEARRQRISWREAIRVALWPPAWWSGWWPMKWRRPGDLWPRLPAFLRRARTAGTLMIAFYVPFAWMLILTVRDPLQTTKLAKPFAALSITILVSFIWLLHAASRKLRKAGLNRYDVSRAVGHPTWSAHFWSRPEIARVLLPAGGPSRNEQLPRTPAEIAAGVRKIAAALPPHHAALTKEAVARADAIVRRIGMMDGELASLAKEVRHEDVVAVERRIADFGPERSDEPSVRREIRQMHQQQLAVLQRLQRQVEEGQTRREQLAGLLRTLYLQVSELNVEAKKLTDVDTSAVRAIVDQMAREVEGLKEVGG
jgi:predicted Ser/Thr protein kinase